MPISPNKVTYSEFLVSNKNSEKLMEFINGEVYF